MCRMEAGALSFYSGARVPWGFGQVSGDNGDGGHVGPGEWAHRVGDVEAATMSVMAKQGVDGSRRATSRTGGTMADGRQRWHRLQGVRGPMEMSTG